MVTDGTCNGWAFASPDNTTHTALFVDLQDQLRAITRQVSGLGVRGEESAVIQLFHGRLEFNPTLDDALFAVNLAFDLVWKIPLDLWSSC